MNDRFKFRAYVKANEEIETVDVINFIDGCTEWGEPEIIVGGVGRTFDEVILMQCTGLKDKNGTLIYEGDIVKFNFDTDEIKAVVSWDDKELIGFYLNTTDYFKDKYVTDYDFYKNDYELIGNIYENPKLIKE